MMEGQGRETDILKVEEKWYGLKETCALIFPYFSMIGITFFFGYFDFLYSRWKFKEFFFI